MQRAGVRAVVDSAKLAVVGLVEVVLHLPRIYGEYRKLLSEATRDPPDLAILTDSPDFHLRLARQLKKLGVPVVYLVAPQVWAWRKGRLPLMRRTIDRLLCIFPFEQDFFESHGIAATYIGHPLTKLVRPSAGRDELRKKYRTPDETPLIALLPGSRKGEVWRHLPDLIETAAILRETTGARFVLGLPGGFGARTDLTTFKERFSRNAIQVFEGETWDILASADLALTASGTVTIEASLLRTPMIAFYRVNRLSWWMGKFLVRVPFFSMVNLIAGRRVVAEFIQGDMTPRRLATEAERLLADKAARETMKRDLDDVARKLAGPEDPIEFAASIAGGFLSKEEMAHAS
jgi:lipid-A-disaccharide synthase